MKPLHTLLDPLRPASIRNRMLLMALLPALLTALGMVVYFTTQNLATAKAALHARADNAARHLAGALPYALIAGDTAQSTALLETEMANSQLAFVILTDANSKRVTTLGDALHPAEGKQYYRQHAQIVAPTADLQDDALYAAPTALPAVALGRVEVGISLAQIADYQRTALGHAALLMLGALAVAGSLAWRLSNRLAQQLRHIGQVVSRLSRDDLAVRTELPPRGEVGALAAGINDMAVALQSHRDELERRIQIATADLAAKKELAERANQAKSRFFAAASHDLRQPLHALSLFVSALKARIQQPEAQVLIDNIELSTATMELLFNALLDISRLDAGAIEAHRTHFSLQKMLDDLSQQFTPLAAEKRLDLRIRPAALTLYSDPLLLERILANLIANAIRYTDDGGVLVACRQRGRQVRISVFDTGRGIPPEQQESVFQEFVQLHNQARDRSKGLGLGLAIVSRLGRLLGHRVDLQSRPDRGSVFSIEIPLGEAALIQTPAPAILPGRTPDDALVLLVDDESAILRGMAELFDNWNIDLVAAHSAHEAEHWLDSLGRVPDVIVCDYRLPGEDGLEVIARLRRKFSREVPAILVTGDTAPDTLLRITQAGFPLLHKPLRPAKLRALLTYLIQQSRAGGVG